MYNVGEQRDGPVSTPVRSIDVIPTLFDEVGIEFDTESPAGPDGASLLSLLQNEPEAQSEFEIAFSSTTAYENPDAVGVSAISKLSVVRDDWKLIWTQADDEIELYNRLEDPDEQTDKSAERDDIADSLMSLIKSELQKTTVDTEHTEENTVRERLEDLGYL
jgi:arylsulfatase A-like enzyme